MEQDVLGHLIQVEHDAASILFDAQVEADKRTAEAHVQADNEYKIAYDNLVEKLENDCAQKIKENNKLHTEAFEAYKIELQKTEKDVKNFNAYMETLFFGE